MKVCVRFYKNLRIWRLKYEDVEIVQENKRPKRHIHSCCTQANVDQQNVERRLERETREFIHLVIEEIDWAIAKCKDSICKGREELWAKHEIEDSQRRGAQYTAGYEKRFIGDPSFCEMKICPVRKQAHEQAAPASKGHRGVSRQQSGESCGPFPALFPQDGRRDDEQPYADLVDARKNPPSFKEFLPRALDVVAHEEQAFLGYEVKIRYEQNYRE